MPSPYLTWDAAANATFPARLCVSVVSLAGLLGGKKMYLLTLPVCIIAAVLAASVLAGVMFTAVWYLKDYEDWKANKFGPYLEKLKKDPEAAMKERPDVLFSPAYKYMMLLCIVCAVLASAVYSPALTERLIGASALPVEYYIGGALVTVVFTALALDRFLARPVADLRMKKIYNKAGEELEGALIAEFQSNTKKAEAADSFDLEKLKTMKAWFAAMPELDDKKE